jgi:hypothetical protein
VVIASANNQVINPENKIPKDNFHGLIWVEKIAMQLINISKGTELLSISA